MMINFTIYVISVILSAIFIRNLLKKYVTKGSELDASDVFLFILLTMLPVINTIVVVLGILSKLSDIKLFYKLLGLGNYYKEKEKE